MNHLLDRIKRATKKIKLGLNKEDRIIFMNENGTFILTVKKHKRKH